MLGRRWFPAHLRSRLGIPLSAEWERFCFNSNHDIRTHIKHTYGYEGDLLELFAANLGKEVHKWHHYIPLYDRYFSRYRGKRVRFLEIGVAGGGSLTLWRKFFGPQAIIYGIDINPDCAQFDDQDAQVRIGSQNNQEFLESVIAEMGGVDVVLDDGSHIMEDIITTLKIVFPRLAKGGIYLIEDLHTCYWRQYGGRYGSKSNVYGLITEVINDMHHWYHDSGMKHGEISSQVSGIHIHDSIVVLDKWQSSHPVNSRVA